jgi:hypothetical protein
MRIDNFYNPDLGAFPRVQSGYPERVESGPSPPAMSGEEQVVVRPSTNRLPYMKIAGFLLLLAGWGIVITAVSLLRASAPRGAFVAAGMGVEILGLVLAARAHVLGRGRKK